jgi:hypothetical protein
MKEHVRVFQSSGTTQEIKGAHFFDTLSLYNRCILPPFDKYLLPDRAKLSYYFLISSAAEQPHSSLSYMMQVVRQHFTGGRGTYYIKKGIGQFEKLAADLQKEKNKIFLLATTFSLQGFLDFLTKRKIKLRLAPGSQIMETGGFKGQGREIFKSVFYAERNALLGIPKTHCVSEYGMTELSSQMYDTTLYDFVNQKKRKSIKVGPSWLCTLVIDPRTGKEAARGTPGLLRHFDLANRGSVMAVETEDLGRVSGEGFELIGRMKGAGLRGCSLNYEELIKSGV